MNTSIKIQNRLVHFIFIVCLLVSFQVSLTAQAETNNKMDVSLVSLSDASLPQGALGNKDIMTRHVNKILSDNGINQSAIVLEQLGVFEIVLKNDVQKQKLAADFRIDLVAPNGIFRIMDESDEDASIVSPPAVVDDEIPEEDLWGLTDIGGAGTYTSGTAWVMDTGISLDTGDLNVDETHAINYVADIGDTDGDGDVSEVIPAAWDDDQGHGTHMSGIIAAIDNTTGVIGAAPGAPVVPIKICDSTGMCWADDVMRGYNHVALYAVEGDIVNLSLSADFVSTEILIGLGHLPSGTIHLPGTSASVRALRFVLKRAINRAASATHAMFICAAGNDLGDLDTMSDPLIPASMNGTYLLTVTGYDTDGEFRARAVYGSAVDWAAPGQSITSLSVDGGTESHSGTSQATAFVSGIYLAQGFISENGTVEDPTGREVPKAHF